MMRCDDQRTCALAVRLQKVHQEGRAGEEQREQLVDAHRQQHVDYLPAVVTVRAHDILLADSFVSKL